MYLYDDVNAVFSLSDLKLGTHARNLGLFWLLPILSAHPISISPSPAILLLSIFLHDFPHSYV